MIGVGVGAGVGAGVTCGVGAAVGSGVGAGVGLGFGVRFGAGVGVGAGVALGVGAGVALGVGTGVDRGVGLGTGVGAGVVATGGRGVEVGPGVGPIAGGSPGSEPGLPDGGGFPGPATVGPVRPGGAPDVDPGDDPVGSAVDPVAGVAPPTGGTGLAMPEPSCGPEDDADPPTTTRVAGSLAPRAGTDGALRPVPIATTTIRAGARATTTATLGRNWTIGCGHTFARTAETDHCGDITRDDSDIAATLPFVPRRSGTSVDSADSGAYSPPQSRRLREAPQARRPRIHSPVICLARPVRRAA